MNPSWRKNYLRYKSYFLNVIEQYKERADLKVYLELFLSLGTISLLGLFALRPTLRTIAELQKEIEAKEKTIAIMDEKIENINKAKNLYELERSRIELLETAIPRNPDVDVFARHLEGLSAKHQVNFERLSMGQATILGEHKEVASPKKARVKPMPQGAKDVEFLVGVTAPIEQYLSLSNFLSDFEKLRRPAKIDGLTFKKSTDRDTDQEGLPLTISGRLPYFTGLSKNKAQ